MSKVKIISKTVAVQKILNSGGRIFTAVFNTVKGKEKSLNCKVSKVPTPRKNQDKILGLVTVYDVHSKSYKRLNTRGLKRLAISKSNYKIR